MPLKRSELYGVKMCLFIYQYSHQVKVPLHKEPQIKSESTKKKLCENVWNRWCLLDWNPGIYLIRTWINDKHKLKVNMILHRNGSREIGNNIYNILLHSTHTTYCLITFLYILSEDTSNYCKWTITTFQMVDVNN